MPPKVDQLKQKLQIHGYRSSERIGLIQNANIVYVEKEQKKIEVECPNGTESTIGISVPDIQYVKMKDFTDRENNTRYILSVGEQIKQTPEEQELRYQRTVQHSLQFESKAERDLWDHGLRSILATVATTKSADDSSTKKKRSLPVKKVTLIPPGDHSGILVSIKVELDGEERIGTLEIKADESDAESCKKLTNEFVDHHGILPTESTSLYRYIRSVVQRAMMEKETAAIVDEINLNRFERVAGTLGLDVKNTEDNAKILERAVEQLDAIFVSITTRIGQHGCGATIVNTILKRNVEKMKVINDLAAKVALVDPHAAAIMPDKAG